MHYNVCDDVTAELKTWCGQAAPRKMSYTKITQKHLFSTVVSSFDMLSHTVGLKQYNSV